MNLRDYLIDQAGKDWAHLLAGWAPPLTEYYPFMAHIYKQTKDLPDGTPVRAVVRD